MNKVYPIGYNAPGSAECVAELMKKPQMIIVDTRLHPTSRFRPEWRMSALKEQYKDGYIHDGRLGNLNYKNGGPIKIVNPDAGIDYIARLLRYGHDLILLCQCRDYNKCHRKVIVALLKEAMPEVEVCLDEIKPAQGALF